MFDNVKAENPAAYYYDFLSPRQKHEYRCILKAIKNRDAMVAFPIPIRALSLMGVISAVMGDNHDLFWVDVNWMFHRYTFCGQDTNLVFGMKFKYLMDEQEQAEVAEQLKVVEDRILWDVSNFGSELAKARYIFDWLVRHATYIDQDEGPHSQTIKGALLDGATACAGFSHAMAHLCTKAGISCQYIWGRNDSGAHAWNRLVLDGREVYCDIASSLLPEGDGTYKPTDMFFAFSSADMERFGMRPDFPETALYAPESDYTTWELSGGYSGNYDFDRCVWALARAKQGKLPPVNFAFENDGLEHFLADFMEDGSEGVEAVSFICGEQVALYADFVSGVGVVSVEAA